MLLIEMQHLFISIPASRTEANSTIIPFVLGAIKQVQGIVSFGILVILLIRQHAWFLR